MSGGGGASTTTRVWPSHHSEDKITMPLGQRPRGGPFGHVADGRDMEADEPDDGKDAKEKKDDNVVDADFEEVKDENKEKSA